MIQVLFRPWVASRRLGQSCPDRLKERHVITNSKRLWVGDSQCKRLGQCRDSVQRAFFAILLRQDMLHRCRQQSHALLRRPRGPRTPVKPMEEATADLVLLQEHGDSYLL